MTLTRFLMSISCSTLCSISCVQHSPIEKDKKEPEAVLDKLVGRVSAIYPKAHYMLIQKYRTINTDADAVFYSRSEAGVISSVRLTDQKLGQFYVADLGSGDYSINDPIFMRDLRNDSEVDAIESDTTSKKTQLNF